MDAYKLKTLIDEYVKRHNLTLKKSYFNPHAVTYQVTTTDYTELDAKVSKGKKRIIFKVDGKVSSIYA